MVFSINTLACWRLKKKNGFYCMDSLCIDFWCKTCHLTCGFTLVLYGKYDNGATSSEFCSHKFLPPVWVLVVVTPFRLGHFYDSFLQVAMPLLRVALFLLVWLSPELSFLIESTSLKLLSKALHSRIFVSPITLNGSLYLFWVSTGRAQAFFHIVFKRSLLSSLL
jgi:hypothetical protein